MYRYIISVVFINIIPDINCVRVYRACFCFGAAETSPRAATKILCAFMTRTFIPRYTRSGRRLSFSFSQRTVFIGTRLSRKVNTRRGDLEEWHFINNIWFFFYQSFLSSSTSAARESCAYTYIIQYIGVVIYIHIHTYNNNNNNTRIRIIRILLYDYSSHRCRGVYVYNNMYNVI